MDKQKQLNEMHQILLSAGYDWWNTAPNGKTKSEYEAECFYNAGYRKIPEGSVVRTREEDTKLFNDYVEYIKQVRKETAEKIYKGLCKKWGKMKNCILVCNESEDLENLIDEICKEITEGGGQG
jgi:hypothetical protein